MSRLKVRQIRSTIGRKKNQRETLRSLGLGRIGKQNELEVTPALEGKLRKVAHLVRVEGN